MGPSTPIFRTLYEEHFAYVYHYLRRMGVPTRHIEDVAQDVFVVVYRKLKDYDPARPMRPWLAGIAYRVALDHRRKASNAREIPAEDVSERQGPRPTDPRAHEARALLMRALDTIPLERRVVVILHELDEHPVADIAHALELPLHTVYSRLRKARTELVESIRTLKSKETP